MALEITKALTTQIGLQVPSGTYIKFDTLFSKDGDKAVVSLNPYVSKGVYDNGDTFFVPKELENNLNVVLDLATMSQQEQAIFEAAVMLIHEKVKGKLEAISSIGNNVEIV